jgi:hypothetical protein
VRIDLPDRQRARRTGGRHREVDCRGVEREHDRRERRRDAKQPVLLRHHEAPAAQAPDGERGHRSGERRAAPWHEREVKGEDRDRHVDHAPVAEPVAETARVKAAERRGEAPDGDSAARRARRCRRSSGRTPRLDMCRRGRRLTSRARWWRAPRRRDRRRGAPGDRAAAAPASRRPREGRANTPSVASAATNQSVNDRRRHIRLVPRALRRFLSFNRLRPRQP